MGHPAFAPGFSYFQGQVDCEGYDAEFYSVCYVWFEGWGFGLASCFVGCPIAGAG
jgi:hypothetical protein